MRWYYDESEAHQAAMERRWRWRKWFAWYPIQIGTHRIWLEPVERRPIYFWGEDGHIPVHEYRLIQRDDR